MTVTRPHPGAGSRCPDLPRRARRDLVGCRRHLERVGTGRRVRRLVVATADPAALPDKVTWYLVTNLPRPGGPREAGQPAPSSPPGRDHPDLRHPQLDRAELQAGQGRARLGRLPGPLDVAIRRHQALVNCAFSFCWDAWFADHPSQHHSAAPRPEPGRGESGAARRTTAGPVLATGAARGPRLAFPLDRAAALVDRMVQGAPAPAAASPDQLGRGRLRPAPLHP